jgi:hypothetical protein
VLFALLAVAMVGVGMVGSVAVARALLRKDRPPLVNRAGLRALDAPLGGVLLLDGVEASAAARAGVPLAVRVHAVTTAYMPDHKGLELSLSVERDGQPLASARVPFQGGDFTVSSGARIEERFTLALPAGTPAGPAALVLRAHGEAARGVGLSRLLAGGHTQTLGIVTVES